MPADIAPGNIVQAQQAPDSADPIVVFEDVSITFDIKPVLQNMGNQQASKIATCATSSSG